jgi:hypothetical protein
MRSPDHEGRWKALRSSHGLPMDTADTFRRSLRKLGKFTRVQSHRFLVESIANGTQRSDRGGDGERRENSDSQISVPDRKSH